MATIFSKFLFNLITIKNSNVWMLLSAYSLSLYSLHKLLFDLFWASSKDVLSKQIIRELRSSCNFLIAFDSLLGIIFVVGHLIPLVQIFSRRLIPYSMCLPIIIVPLLANETTSIIIVTIGLDRFLHALFPIWYVGIRTIRF